MISNNPITENIDINHRMIISKKTVFRVSMIDDFTNEGLYSMTLIQTVFNSKDDRENKIAYNDDFSDEITERILGDDYIFLGSETVYSCSGATNWSVTSDYDYVELIDLGEQCKVKCKDDSNFIGETFELSTIANGHTVKKEIMIRGLF